MSSSVEVGSSVVVVVVGRSYKDSRYFFGENLKFIKIRTPFLSVPSSTRPVEFFYEYLLLMVSGDQLENFYHPGQMKIRYLRKLSLKPRGFPRNLFLDNFYMHLLYSPI